MRDKRMVAKEGRFKLENANQQPVDVWLCLQCGKGVCTKHHKNHAPHGEVHAIAVWPAKDSVWCFECQRQVKIAGDHQALQLISMIREWYRKFLWSRNNLLTFSTGPELSLIRGFPNTNKTCYLNCILVSLCYCPGMLSILSQWCQKSRQQHFPASRSTHLPQFPDQEAMLRIPLEIKAKKQYGPLSIEVNEPPRFLTAAFLRLITQAHQQSSSTKCDTANLVQVLTRRHTLFQSPGHPQDAHECLRVLVDEMKGEELMRTRVGILNKLNIPRTIDPRTVSGDRRNEVKHYGRLALLSTVWDHLFGGHFITSLQCLSCSRTTASFEPFLDIVLPIDLPALRRNNNTATKANRRKRKRSKSLQSQYLLKRRPSCSSVLNDSMSSIPSSIKEEDASCISTTDLCQKSQSVPKSSDDISDAILMTMRPMQSSLPCDLKPSTDLEHCLLQFTRPDLLLGANAPLCSSCPQGPNPTRSSTVRTSLIYQPPLILPICLKRFQVKNARCEKIQHHVSFPLELNLTAFASQVTSVSWPRYRLFALIEHCGAGVDNGHYSTYIRTSSSPPLAIATDITFVVPDFLQLTNQVQEFIANKETPIVDSQTPQTAMEIDNSLDNDKLASVDAENLPRISCSKMKHTPNSKKSSVTLEKEFRWFCINDEDVREVSQKTVLSRQAYILFYHRIEKP